MAKKESFLLVSLQEEKAKELAQIVANKTCKRILEYLGEHEDATETAVAKELAIPLSTAHYNLQLLTKANLVEASEFHYSAKGKEVLHYKLAHKYIVIAPKTTYGIKEKLKAILPVGLLTLGAAWLVDLFSSYQVSSLGKTAFERAPAVIQTMPQVVQDTSVQTTSMMLETMPELVVEPVFFQQPWFWFIIGASFAIGLYLLIDYFRKR